jgi:hypothetical protein
MHIEPKLRLCEFIEPVRKTGGFFNCIPKNEALQTVQSQWVKKLEMVCSTSLIYTAILDFFKQY